MSAPLNPLRNDGTALPPRLLLVAKLFVVALLLKGYVGGLPDPWLPLVPAFEHLPSRGVREVLMAVFSIAALSLVFNRAVRLAAFTAGLVFLLEPLINRISFAYSSFFGAAILMLIGLWRSDFGTRVLRWQFVVMYFGTGLNKLLDPDWRSGQFIQYWMDQMPGAQRYHGLDRLVQRLSGSELEPTWLAQGFSLAAIASELGLAVLCSRPQWSRVAVWCAVGFHTSSVIFIESSFGVFISLLMVSFLLLLGESGAGSIRLELRVRRGSRIGQGLRSLSPWTHPGLDLVWSEAGERAAWIECGAGAATPGGSGARRGLAAFNRYLAHSPWTYWIFIALVAFDGWPNGLGIRVLEVCLLGGILWFFPPTARLIALPVDALLGRAPK